MIRTAGLPNLRDTSTWLLILAGLGVFFAADDQTSVVAVLPSMIKDVGLAQDQFYRAAWIVNGYILGYVVAMPLMGRVADAYGRGRIFSLALVLFCVGSAWVALSSDLTMLSIARAVQAIGGGAVVPVSMALVMQLASPSRRALGLGAMAAASEAGGLIGPLWGGGIADLLGWRWMFWINLPMCLPIAAALWLMARRESRVARQDLDLPGATLLGISLVCLTIALTDDPIQPRGTLVTLLLFGGRRRLLRGVPAASGARAVADLAPADLPAATPERGVRRERPRRRGPDRRDGERAPVHERRAATVAAPGRH